MTEDQRRLDHEATHPTMPVVVRIRAAHTHRRNPYEDVTCCGLRYRSLGHFDASRLDEYGSPHLGISGKCCVRHTPHASVMSIYSHP